MRERVILVDCNHVGHASAFTHGKLEHNSMRTGVIYGFLDRIISIHSQLKADKFIFCWDSKKSVRRDMYPPYKANRRSPKVVDGVTDEEAEEDKKQARLQFDMLRRVVLPNMGFRNVWVQAGYEADDLIAMAVNLLFADGYMPVIVSSDKDLYQLLSVAQMYKPNSNSVYTAEDLMQETGATPGEVWRMKAIAGCSTDNVAGIKGVGEPTALKYIHGELKPSAKTVQRIESPDGEAVIIRNRALVKLPLDGTKCTNMVPDIFWPRNFRSMCKEFGFKSFLHGYKQEMWASLLGGES
jgi:5'-3' exonuclease